MIGQSYAEQLIWIFAQSTSHKVHKSIIVAQLSIYSMWKVAKDIKMLLLCFKCLLHQVNGCQLSNRDVRVVNNEARAFS